eukprot:jgi/Botrbrau1/21147/Bobra.0061s0041.1
MGDEQRPVEMIRIEPRERVYLREDIFGRDAKSVFPNESTAAEGLELEATKAALGARAFISEMELEELKSARGERVEDGTIALDKPLAQVLEEAKQAKEDAFQAVWKSMKTGKNRPLDEDELDFVNGLEEARRKIDAAIRQDELSQLETFQKAVREAAEARSLPAGPRRDPPARSTNSTSGKASKATEGSAKAPSKLPVVIRAVPKARPNVEGQRKQMEPAEGLGVREHPAGAEEPQLKRPRNDARDVERNGSGGIADEVGGLSGLLSGYGSDDDSP